MASTNRRSVDWAKLSRPDVPLPTMVDGAAAPEHATLLSALDDLLACDHVDAILRCAVEIARDRVGLTRVAIFQRDVSHGVMRGTWGTDLDGTTIDEHHITFDLWRGHDDLFEHGARDGIYWTVVENAPIIAHLPAESRVVGCGWLCCTPIRSGTVPFGIMYNDAGLTAAPLDGSKQTQGALLCSLLGTALDLACRRGKSVNQDRIPARSPAVVKATRLLASDPAMTAEELGARLRLSASRMARIFKSEMGMSLVEYRNRLRLERFSTLLDQKGDNLLEAALTAGFGSYAQFHRVFLALRGTTPGKFLRARSNGNDKSATANEKTG